MIRQFTKQLEPENTKPTDVRLPKGELLVGSLVEFDGNGRPCVRVAWGEGSHTLSATPAISVNNDHIGRQAVVMLAGLEVQTPVLLGFVHSTFDPAPEEGARACSETAALRTLARSVG